MREIAPELNVSVPDSVRPRPNFFLLTKFLGKPGFARPNADRGIGSASVAPVPFRRGPVFSESTRR